MFKTINNDIKPDVAIWNGGTVASNIDTVTLDQILKTMERMTKLVAK